MNQATTQAIGFPMDFGDAIRVLKRGMLVQRQGWNGKNMYLFLERNHASPNDDRNPCIIIFTAQGKFQPGWLASQEDILAEDWHEVAVKTNCDPHAHERLAKTMDAVGKEATAKGLTETKLEELLEDTSSKKQPAEQQPEEDRRTYGQRAYEEFRKHRFEDINLGEWKDLPDKVKCAWNVAGNAVHDEATKDQTPGLATTLVGA